MITTPVTDNRFTPEGWAGYHAFKADHPEPSTLDFRCPRCKAEPGQLCPGRPLGHAQRQDRMIYAHQEWQYDATNAGINAGYAHERDSLHQSGYRCSTDNHVKYMRRNKARIRQPGEPATTVKFGEWLLAHTSRAAPLSYLGIRSSIRRDMDVADVEQLLEADDWAAQGALNRAAKDWGRLTGTRTEEPAS